MKIQKYLPAILGTIALIFVITLMVINKNSEMILFYGDTCPHCKNVDEFMTANKIEEKIEFRKLEVYNHQDNAQLLTQTAKNCGLDTTKGVGVPFFYDGKTCLVGDTDIINFFKNYGNNSSQATD
jgi:glutaredoxin